MPAAAGLKMWVVFGKTGRWCSRANGLRTRVLAVVGAAACLLAGAVQAADVLATFSLPAGFEGKVVSWSATPLDLPPDADVLSAMIIAPEALAGPWTVTLETRHYLVSAFSDVEVFELTVTLAAEPATQAHEVPLLSLEAAVAYACEGGEICGFEDAPTRLGFALPPGWAAEQPYFADLGEGARATEVSTVFFEDVEGDGGSVWFLNPVDWIEDDAGPCRDVAVGVLCTFDLGGTAEAGFAVIGPSLSLLPVAP